MSRPAITVLGSVVGAALLSLGATACAAGSPPAVPEGADGTQDPVLVLGRDVYGEHCSNCHGTDGGGNRGPRLAGGSVVERYPEPSDEALLIAGGRGGMPSFAGSLSAAEIDAVVAYTREVL